jgi:hypothetical protein
LRQDRSVTPTVLDMVPPSVPVDGLVNFSDGARDMVCVDDGVDLTLRR